MDDHDERVAEMKQRGISDLASGIERATLSGQALLTAARMGMEGHSINGDPDLLALLGFVNRARSLHEGSVSAIVADNPFAAAACLRAYSELVGALIWIRDKPKDLGRFAHTADKSDAPTIGRIKNGVRNDSSAFESIYDNLSGYVHPTSMGGLLSFTMPSADVIEWHSEPTFRQEHSRMRFCSWVVECAEFAGALLIGLFVDYWRTRLDQEAAD